MNLYIYKYNNYYNRIVKFEDSLADYGEPVHILQDCKDFTPGDGVNTVHIFGSHLVNYNGSGDYLIVTDENNNILSRWFIIDTNFSRQGQWNITMHRDLVVDYYERIINAPCFIEKATLSVDDPLIFNKENMIVNQIKTSETLLKDQSGCAWLVGYYANDATGIKGTVKQNSLTDVPYVDIGYNFDDWPLRKYTNMPLEGQTTEPFYGYPTSGYYYINAITDLKVAGGPESIMIYTIATFKKSIFGSLITYTEVESLSTNHYPQATFDAKGTSGLLNVAYTPKISSLMSQLSSYVSINSSAAENEFVSLDGKVIKTLDGKFFDCVVQKTLGVSTGITDAPAGSGLRLTLEDIAKEAEILISANDNSNTIQFEISRTSYKIQLKERKDLELNYSIPDSNKLITSDAPWNIFAIPYSDDLIIKGAGADFTTNMQVAIDTAMSIAKQHGSKVYDIQLLPYCPVPALITSDNEITVENTQQYSLISTTEVTYGIIFNVPVARFNVILTSYIFHQASSNIERKLNNECDKWRLTAPNYSNYFDFSVEKNNGIQSFDIDCEYKPFTPYIHINPVFGGLYGYDDNSPRGLVLGGDFSLSRISDKWIEYEIQNKNYQLTFDRQIQNMEVQQDIQRIQERWQVGLGTVQGAVAGATSGALVGGGFGAIAGAVVGGAASLAGGKADINFNEMLRNEALDYTRDMFGYQLGNIQALPNTISKVSSLNNNNKLFPILEYYTCTEREKRAFANKIAWNGMSVGAIGTIKEYLNNNWSYNNIESKGYIKGEIIRIENLDDEFHLLKSISDEIYKGVYF